MAAQLVGGALLSAFLQVAFDRLASPHVLDFFKKRRSNDTLVEKLNIMLLSINTVIDDAEEKQFIDPNAKAWLDKVKDAAYEAEDVLDEIQYEVSKHKLEAETQTTVTSKDCYRLQRLLGIHYQFYLLSCTLNWESLHNMS